MARFVFKLEGVLEHRKHIERERQRDLAQVQQQMAALQRELRELNESMQQATADVRSHHLVGRLDMNLLAAHRRFLASGQRKAMQIAQRMALVQQQIQAAQAALAAAARDRKVLEKLRERHQTRWQLEQSRKETIELDEIATRLGAETMMENGHVA